MNEVRQRMCDAINRSERSPVVATLENLRYFSERFVAECLSLDAGEQVETAPRTPRGNAASPPASVSTTESEADMPYERKGDADG